MSEDLNILDIFFEKNLSEDAYRKMIEKVHSKMEEFSGNEDALTKLLQLKAMIRKKSPNLGDDIIRSPRRYRLREDRLSLNPILKMGNEYFNLDFKLADIAEDIAKLKPGERIALGRDTLQGDQTGVVKHLNVFYDNGEDHICLGTISRRQCDICRNESGQLEIIDTSLCATQVLLPPLDKRGYPASFIALEDKGKIRAQDLFAMKGKGR